MQLLFLWLVTVVQDISVVVVASENFFSIQLFELLNYTASLFLLNKLYFFNYLAVLCQVEFQNECNDLKF